MPPRAREALRSRTQVNYDMRFHPADMVLRPNYPATKAARRGSGCQSVADENEDNKASEDSENSTDEDEEDLEPPTTSTKQVHSVERYSTRSGRQVKVPDYDMKHHPMDDILRPKATAKRSVRFSRMPSSPTSTCKTVERNLPDLNSSFDNPFTKPITGDLQQLSDFDRRLHQLQGAIPTALKVLPLRWPNVVKKLIEEGLLSKGQLGACGGYAALKARYEQIREAVKEGNSVQDEPTVVDDQLALPEPEENLMQVLRNDVSMGIQRLMSEDEIDDLITQQEIETSNAPVATSDDSSRPETEDLPLSSNAPLGVRRAALRLRETKQALKRKSEQEQYGVERRQDVHKATVAAKR